MQKFLSTACFQIQHLVISKPALPMIERPLGPVAPAAMTGASMRSRSMRIAFRLAGPSAYVIPSLPRSRWQKCRATDGLDQVEQSSSASEVAARPRDLRTDVARCRRPRAPAASQQAGTPRPLGRAHPNLLLFSPVDWRVGTGIDTGLMRRLTMR
jgi:hypothetical protein